MSVRNHCLSILALAMRVGFARGLCMVLKKQQQLSEYLNVISGGSFTDAKAELIHPTLENFL